jgi:hypothetical protein
MNKLREILEEIACLGNGNIHGNSKGNMLAIKALKELDSLVVLDAGIARQVARSLFCTGQAMTTTINEIDRQLAAIEAAKEKLANEQEGVHST